MKINEVISEAINTGTGTPKATPAQAAPAQAAPAPEDTPARASLWNKVKGFVPGTAERQAKVSGQQATQRNQEDAKIWVNKWTQGVQANPASNTPANLQKYARQLATRHDGTQLFAIPKPTDMSPKGVSQFLTNIVARVSAGIENGPAVKKATAKAPAPAQGSKVFGQMANQLGQQPGDEQTATPATTATPPVPDQPQDIVQQAQAAGVQIKNQEPIIITTGKGKEYGLDDRGQWIHLASGKVQPESLQQFLSQQHDISLGMQK